ncbi:hypothetical protein ACHAC9_08140 [Massilia sp. CMS3.1]|uniref:hypothetical protein n=1 Tax=Massilia sp. CMS3.1 TaxID=3373083 RepID=UPI003EE66F3F
MEQLICSHKYKTTVSLHPLNAVWKFFELFFQASNVAQTPTPRAGEGAILAARKHLPL